MGPVGQDHVGAGIEHPMCQFRQPRALLVRVDREHDEIGRRGRGPDRGDVCREIRRIDPTIPMHGETAPGLEA